MKVVRWIAAAFVLAGLGLLAGSAVSWRSTTKFLEESASTQGIVTEVDRRHTSDRRGRSSTYYVYQFRFTPAQGRAIEAFANEGSSSPEYQVGDETTIRYRRADPTDVEIDDFRFIWFKFTLLLALAIAALAMGVGNVWLSFRKLKSHIPIALTFAVPPITAGLVLFIMFGHVVVQVILFAILAWIASGVVRDKRKKK